MLAPKPRGPDLVGRPPSRISAATILLWIGAITAVAVMLPSGAFDLDRFTHPKETVLVVTATITFLLFALRTSRFDFGAVDLLLLASLGAAVLSGLFATNRWIAARAVSVSMAGTAIYFVARHAASRDGPLPVVAGLAAGVAVGFGSGLAQAYGWDAAILANTRAPGGTLGNRNFMAHLTVMGLPLALYILATARRRVTVVLVSFMITGMAAATVLSRSRAAWVGAIVTGSVLLAVAKLTQTEHRRIPRRRLAVLAGAVTLGISTAVLLPNELTWRSSSPYAESLIEVANFKEGSGRGRLIQYENSLGLLTAHPIFGVGPGNWMVEYPTVTTPKDPSFAPHNLVPTNPWPSSDWIAMLVERGPVGAVLWFLTLGSLLVIAYRRTRDPEHGIAALSAIGLITALSVVGLFDAVMLLAPPTFVAMAGLGALLPATRPVKTVELTKRTRWKVLVPISGALILASAYSVAGARAIVIAKSGWDTDLLKRAVRYDPTNYRLHLLLASRAPCPAARKHAAKARALLPNHPAPKRLERRCSYGARR